MRTSEQMRAARAALRMEQADLAARSGVSAQTIKRFEKMNGAIKGQYETLLKIRQVFEDEGIRFLDDDDQDGPGFRFAKNPLERLRKMAAAKAAGLIEAILYSAEMKDPEIYFRGPEHVASVIETNLPALLRRVLRSALPEEKQKRK